ncbi:cupredoxin domain-containing protein [Arthrobacter sp. ISL-48]|uniref:cupredoxin domain-containing protein n=1 Tax=Arthrobacter sp. ISL-48 TaxID=2819110 RepID=UPI001BE86FA6|nr:cupredoxin domain-containing protein [Arthrobacter sp. ISL-48]MBT2534329.1 cupredoxin domain-containing protein [Arthrobacter sp. ISL-48]
MRLSNRVLAAAAAGLLTGLAGCGSPGGGAAPQPTSSGSSSVAQDSSGSATVTISGFAYQVPASVKPGATVTVVNKDSAPHTVTAKDKGGFDVEVDAGKTATFTAPAEAGEYGIICTFHPKMSGTLVVK